MSISTLLALVIIGFFAGSLSGFVGVGGGIIMVPLLVMVLGLTQHEAQGTSIFAMLPPIGILAAMNYYRDPSVSVSWESAAVIAFTFIIGGYLGSKLSLSLSGSTVRKVFAVIMFVGAIKMFFLKEKNKDCVKVSDSYSVTKDSKVLSDDR
jgi:hypothetical protein